MATSSCCPLAAAMSGATTATVIVQHDFMLEKGYILVAVALSLVHAF